MLSFRFNSATGVSGASGAAVSAAGVTASVLRVPYTEVPPNAVEALLPLALQGAPAAGVAVASGHLRAPAGTYLLVGRLRTEGGADFGPRTLRVRQWRAAGGGAPATLATEIRGNVEGAACDVAVHCVCALAAGDRLGLTMAYSAPGAPGAPAAPLAVTEGRLSLFRLD